MPARSLDNTAIGNGYGRTIGRATKDLILGKYADPDLPGPQITEVEKASMANYEVRIQRSQLRAFGSVELARTRRLESLHSKPTDNY